MLHHAVYLYAHPDRAGGDSLVGATYRDRVAAYDPTVLDEFLATAIEELLAIRADNDREIERVTATSAAPGTTGKIEEMVRRMGHGRSLFSEEDGPR